MTDVGRGNPSLRAVRLLIESGADMYSVARGGLTPLDLWVGNYRGMFRGHPMLVRFVQILRKRYGGDEFTKRRVVIGESRVEVCPNATLLAEKHTSTA